MTISNYREIFERVRQFMTRRVQACIKSQGGHFRHFLQIHPFNSVTRRRIICGPTFIWTRFLVPVWAAHPLNLPAYFWFTLYTVQEGTKMYVTKSWSVSYARWDLLQRTIMCLLSAALSLSNMFSYHEASNELAVVGHVSATTSPETKVSTCYTYK
jgi:hypothetical protein